MRAAPFYLRVDKRLSAAHPKTHPLAMPGIKIAYSTGKRQKSAGQETISFLPGFSGAESRGLYRRRCLEKELRLPALCAHGFKPLGGHFENGTSIASGLRGAQIDTGAAGDAGVSTGEPRRFQRDRMGGTIFGAGIAFHAVLVAFRLKRNALGLFVGPVSLYMDRGVRVRVES